MPNSVRIALVTSDRSLASNVLLRLHSKGYQGSSLACFDSVLGVFYSDPPDLLIIDLSTDRDCAVKVVTTLRRDSFFSAIPIIGLMGAGESGSFDWECCPLDDFTILPPNFNELFCRISLSLARLKRVFDNNPLTRLPGNTSIQRAIQDAMGLPLAVCYVDINHFKPYNDVFGFSHGDEVIRMLARIMFNAVHDADGGFCGHIGGDDFVCIIPVVLAEMVCQTIIGHFDQIVLDLFDEQTKGLGYYLGTNRKGEEEKIPLLSVSIGIVPMDSPRITHFARVAELAAELKKRAKQSEKSCCVIDKRRQ